MAARDHGPEALGPRAEGQDDSTRGAEPRGHFALSLASTSRRAREFRSLFRSVKPLQRRFFPLKDLYQRLPCSSSPHPLAPDGLTR